MTLDGSPSPENVPVNVSKRRWPQILTAVGALAVIGGAGYLIWQQAPWVARPEPDPILQNSGPVVVPTFRSRLTVRQGGPGDPAVIVALGRPESPAAPELTRSADPRRLLNEIVRQAVLLAASNQRAARTRDAMIGEEPPAGQVLAEADVTWILTRSESDSALTITPAGGDGKDKGRGGESHVLKLPPGDSAYVPTAATYRRVLERAEQLAGEELPRVIKTLRLEGAPVAVKAEGPLPTGAETRLTTMTFTEQFAALRAIQAVIRHDGESPERLGGLIRAYANLGVLTESHWNPAHDVFKARALLLAQRWVARQPQSPAALGHRAYAYALAGLHRFALDDLAAIKARPGGAGATSDRDRLIEAYCRFDTKALRDASAGADRELARLLAFLTVEGTASPARKVELGRALLRENPECYRVHDAVCAAGGISVLHEATMAPFAVYANELPRRLKAIDDLPPGIVPKFDDAGNAAGAVKVLIEAGRSTDRGEPSWGVLGHLMQETCFSQVWRRSRFLAFGLGVPAGEFVEAARPLFADHPYRPLIDALGADHTRDVPRYMALVRDVNIPAADVELTELPFFLDMLQAVDQQKSQTLFQEACLREDSLEHDLKQALPRMSPPDRVRNAQTLEDASPHSPVARATRIECDWQAVAERAPAWEADDAPEVLVALGRRYIELKRYQDATRCLERSLMLAPDRSTYEILAYAFRTQGDWKRWQETLDRFLSQEEDYGLDHARVQVEIANHLMDEARWKEAEPYAAAAAESWAAFAMDCAYRCYEGLEDWPKAELWARRKTERYPDSAWAFWYSVCLRNGHGDVDAARQFVASYIASVGNRAVGTDRLAFGFFHLLNGHKEQALSMFRDTTGDDVVGAAVLYAALTADTLGNVELRDRSLERLVTDPQCLANTKSTPIFRAYRAALGAADKSPVDTDVFEKELAAIPEANREGAYFHIGWFLMLHGSPEQAKVYLERSAQAQSVFYWIRITAQAALKDPSLLRPKAPPDPEKRATTGT